MSKSKTDILNYWPFPEWEPRQNQVIALDWLQQQTAKYLLLQAPVGTGKSAIGITYSHFLGSRGSHRGDSFILTPQRILQQQYEDSFVGLQQVNAMSLYGKSNYICSTKNTTCDIGSIVKPKCSHCPHRKAKGKAASSNDTILNYKLALTSFAYTEYFNPRKLMVLDECHTLENHLVDFDALRITQRFCNKHKIKYISAPTLTTALDWLRSEYVPLLKHLVASMEAECESLMDKSGSELNTSDIRKIRELARLQDHCDEATEMSMRVTEYVDEHYVLVHDTTSLTFKRLTGAYTFNKIVKPNADKFLFMSSTILDKDGFCSDLGINNDEAAFLSLDSDFPKEKRPVYFMPQMKMNYQWKSNEQRDNRQQMLDAIKKLLDMHETDKGILHTGSFQVAEWLVSHLEGNTNHTIYHHNPDSGDDRNAVINAYTSDPAPSILISPSITEGLDLRDDLGRFAIIVKTPFGNLTDQWIKKRMEMSPKWYQRRALTDVIQGGGRIVRSQDDWGNVYILDASWAFLYNQTKNMVPHWWKIAYKQI